MAVIVYPGHTGKRGNAIRRGRQPFLLRILRCQDGRYAPNDAGMSGRKAIVLAIEAPLRPKVIIHTG